MNPIYKAKQFIEEGMISARNSFSASSSFICESLEKGFCNSGISGFSSCDPHDAIIGIGTLANGQLEVAFDGHAIPDNSICDLFGYDLCRKIKLSRSSLRTIRMRRSSTYFNVSSGDPIGHEIISKTGGYGTLGSFIITNGQADFIISNNHVLASTNQGKKGDAIYLVKNGQRARIGTLLDYVTIYGDIENDLDIAIARFDGDTVGSMGPGTGIRQPRLGERVIKVGARTGRTTGLVRSIDYTTKVDFDGQSVVFGNQTQIVSNTKGMPFSKSGDSGSVIYAESDGYAIGLLFAGNGKTTSANNGIEVRNQLRSWGLDV